MNQPTNTLETEVRNILLKEWDPIGIKEIAEAQDEYDMYVTGICQRLRAGQPAAEIYSHLRLIVGRMGLDGGEQHTQRIAERLIRLLSHPLSK